nr:Chain B, Epitope peptide [Homo sapiens]5YD3_D Chain D, Epitope peptide [Homo sapiens]5YD3_F Chain F, Epitope peptide [Homo sapiens]5YD3_H Chain H, Epitope peptide [Homo sapiens]
DINYYTSEP